MGPVRPRWNPPCAIWPPSWAARKSACTPCPRPLKTRAASGIAHFDKLIEEAIARTPEHRLVDIEDVGMTTAFLVSGGARADRRHHLSMAASNMA